MARDFRGARSSTLTEIANKIKTSGSAPIMMDLSQLVENPINEYLFGMDGLERLEESIRINGFRGSIGAFRLPDGKAEIYDGHKRFRAKKNIGDSEIPVTLYDMPDNEIDKRNALLYFNLAGRNAVVNDNPLYTARQINFHRETLTLMNFKGEKRKELARTFGISDSQVTKYEAILKLNEELQKKASENHIGLDNISAISKLDEKQQKKVYDYITEEEQKNGECTNATISSIIKALKEDSSIIKEEKEIEKLEEQKEIEDEMLLNKDKKENKLLSIDVEKGEENIEKNSDSEILMARVQVMDNYKEYKKVAGTIENILNKKYEYGEQKKEIIENLKYLKELINDELERLNNNLM